jgi:hypothetical protein
MNLENSRHCFAKKSMSIDKMPLLDVKIGARCAVPAVKIIALPATHVFGDRLFTLISYTLSLLRFF